MATQEQIKTLLDELLQADPTDFQKRMDEVSYGIGAVLRFLYFSEGTVVTAGKISEYMGISTARVAVLLKKMTAKGLIEKEHDAADARVTVVTLSDTGRAAVEKMRGNLYAHIGKLIDGIGMDRMMEFVEVIKEIHAIAKNDGCI